LAGSGIRSRAPAGARSPSPKCASGCCCGVQRSVGFVAGEEGRKIDEGYVGAASINSLGIAILALALIRLAVRLRYGAPALPADLPEPMKLAAHLSHYALYALMIGMPLLGWAMLSAAAYPVVVFRGLWLPVILPQSDSLHTWLWDAHFYLAFAFFALVRCSSGIILGLRRAQVIRPRISGRPCGRERIVRHLHAGRQDDRIEVDVAARSIPLGLDLLRDERADLDGAAVFWPGLAGVRGGVARVGDRHYHGPALRRAGDALSDLLFEVIRAALGKIIG
jgi:hypothetical protein